MKRSSRFALKLTPNFFVYFFLITTIWCLISQFFHAARAETSVASLSDHSGDDETTTKAQIEGWIIEQVETSLNAQFPEAKNMEVRVRLPSSVKSLPLCEGDLSTEPKDGSFLGRESWLIYCDDKWSVKATSTTQLDIQAVVTVKALDKDHRLSAEDLELSWVTLHYQQPVYQDIESLIGRKMRRGISMYKTLTSQYLLFEADIEKGDNVVIVYQSGAIRIETSGIALTSGMIGDTIRVENQNSGKTLTVEVLDNKYVRQF